MAIRVFTDYHHSSLLRSLIMLFEDRLGYEVYRPIGLQWFVEGYWGINDQYDTAKQFLSLNQIPVDGTPPLNNPKNKNKGVYYCYDPGGLETNRACTLEFFKKHKFDYLICSIPAHIPLFQALIRRFQHEAKLIVQIGNEWPEELYYGHNVLASIKPRTLQANAVFYHQEFDLKIFKPTKHTKHNNIYSFVNVLENMPEAQQDFNKLEELLSTYKLRSYGGQNRDGNMTGPVELAHKMRLADFILHSKPGGDGYGHILYNSYAVGRPVIARSSHYRGKLGSELLVRGTFLDLDALSYEVIVDIILNMPDYKLEEMSELAYQQFKNVVNFDKEEVKIRKWLKNLT